MARRNTPILVRVENQIPSKSSLLLAVSGGMDSMCLLHLCMELKRAKLLRLAVVHVNHSLRKESEDDAKFVSARCASLGIHCFQVNLEPPREQKNLENWGRRERYKHFAAVMESDEFDFCLTAHTADDVAETLLMRLIANRPLRSIHAIDHSRRLIRPLLDVSRFEIEQYVKEHSISFVEDGSNTDEKFLRNRIRASLLPSLERAYEPRIRRILSDQARKIHEDTSALEELAREIAIELSPLTQVSREWLVFAQGKLRKLPEALSWRVAERLLFPYCGYLIGSEKGREFVDLVCGGRLMMEISRGPKISRTRQGLKIFAKESLDSQEKLLLQQK